MIQDKIFFDEKDPTGLSYNTPFTFYGSYQGRLWSKAPGGEIKYYTQNSDLSAYATTGSNQFNGNQTVTGSLTVTGTITGTVAGTTATASYVEYTNVANRPALISGSTQIASFGYATTGSNGFNGSQSITGSLTVTGQVVAQTLNVQQVTSSIVFSSGSNIFGNSLANTQQFTGSVGITGSLTVAGTSFTGNIESSGIVYTDVLQNYTGGTTPLTIKTGGGQSLILQTNSTDRLTISSTGAATFSSTVTATQYTATSTGGSGLRIYGAAGTNQWDIYLNGANIRFSDNTGGGRFVVDSPSTLSTTLFSSTSIYQVSIKSTGAQYLLVGSENASGAGIILDGDSNGDGAGGDYSYMFHDSSGVLHIVQDSPSGTNDIRFGTAGTENKVVINSSGNLGVGLTSPGYKIEVAGADSQYWNGTAFTGTPLALAISNTTAGGYDPVLILQQADSGGTVKNAGAIGLVGRASWTAGNNATQISDMYFLVRNSSGGISERMRITSGGNVGIGTASLFSGAKLDVYGDLVLGQQNWAIRGNNSSADIGFEELSGGGFSDANYRVYLKSGGNVGIANTNPNKKLEITTGNGVSDGIRITYNNVTSEGLDITYLNTGATTTSFDSIYNSDSAVMRFRMKTAGTPVTALSILGSGTATFGSSITATSAAFIAPNTVTGTLLVQGGKNDVTSTGEINSRIDFGSNDASVGETDGIRSGGRIASVTEFSNGAFTGMAFSTYQQGRSPALREAMRIYNDSSVGVFGNLTANNFTSSGFVKSHGVTKTFNVQKNLDERLSNVDYFRVQSTFGGGFQVIVYTFSQSTGIGWFGSQIFQAVNTPYWGGWIGSSANVNQIGGESGVISSAVIGNDGSITFRVSTGNNGTNTQSTINSFIQVSAFTIDGIVVTTL